MIRRLLLSVLALAVATTQKRLEREERDGESCGEDAVPYLIEIDQNGKPELFCETPICLEDPPELRRKKRSSKEKRSIEFPVCNHELLETVCVGEREWTSGLKEINNGTHRTLKTECCTFVGLAEARELKTVLLEAGDRFQGGAVRSHGRERSFDLVKEVRKTVNSENRVQYVVSVYRMPCTAASSSSSSATDSDDFTPYSRAAHARTRRRLGRRELAYDDDFDYAPRAGDRKFLDEYDIPPRVLRRMQRRRIMRRRRPLLEEYYDYDMDYAMPMRPMQRNKAGRQAIQAAPVAALALDERLWPVNYELQSLGSGKPPANYAAVEGPQALPEVTVTNDQVDMQAMPMPPPIQDSSSMQSLSALPAAPATNPLNSFPPGPAAPPGTYQVAPTETYAQAPSYAVPKEADTYVRPQHTFDSMPHQEPPHQQYQVQAQPQQQYTYYPSQGNGLNGLFNRMECFAADLMVNTREGPKRMDQLKTGDQVLSVEENMISYSPIIMFLHRDEELLAEFNVITTAKGDSVKLTNEHLIYVSNCEPQSALQLVRAKEVAVGDCVMAVRSPARSLRIDRVVSVEKVQERGIFAPLTSTGDIIVNDVLSSCHSNLAAKTLQQSFFALYRSLARSVSFLLPSLAQEGDLPPGVTYLTAALDLFIPTKAVALG